MVIKQPTAHLKTPYILNCLLFKTVETLVLASHHILTSFSSATDGNGMADGNIYTPLDPTHFRGVYHGSIIHVASRDDDLLWFLVQYCKNEGVDKDPI